MDRIERPSHKRRIHPTPSDQQVQQLLDAAPNHQQRTIILLLATTGLRRSELIQLRAGDVKLADRRITVHGKGDKQRQVIISKELARALRRHLASADITCDRDPFFVAKQGGPLQKSALHRWFSRWLRNARLGDKSYTLHSLRRYAATHWLRSGLNLRQIQILLGHEDPRTTAQYLDYDLEMIEQDMAEKVPPVGNSLDRGATQSLLGKPKSDALSVDIAGSDERVAVAAAKLLVQLLGQVPKQATSRQQ